jgi:4,5-DOPA dioxygenase extradiol
MTTDITDPQADPRPWAEDDGAMPAVYLGHGAPPLLDDELWTSELASWSAQLPTPRAVLIVSAHWESAPLTLGAQQEKTLSWHPLKQ